MSYPVSKSKKKRLRKSRSDKRFEPIKPQLTSLVDIMTLLLIYLLRSFSAEGEIITPSRNLVLPESSAQKRPELTVVITVNNEFILAEGRQLTTVDRVLTNDELVIPELNNWLATRREQTEKIEQYSTKTKFKGDITIQGDKRIHFSLLKKIMYTCGQQGYNNFLLAVTKRGE